MRQEINRELAGDGHDGFLARGAGGQGAFGQDLSPFHHRPVVGLEADQPPGQLYQRSSQTRVAVLRHAALEPCLAATVLSGT